MSVTLRSYIYILLPIENVLTGAMEGKGMIPQTDNRATKRKRR
jgi:hypothetical protein